MSVESHLLHPSHEMTLNLLLFLNLSSLTRSRILHIGDSLPPRLRNDLETLVDLVLNLVSEGLKVEEDNDALGHAPVKN